MNRFTCPECPLDLRQILVAIMNDFFRHRLLRQARLEAIAAIQFRRLIPGLPLSRQQYRSAIRFIVINLYIHRRQTQLHPLCAERRQHSREDAPPGRRFAPSRVAPTRRILIDEFPYLVRPLRVAPQHITRAILARHFRYLFVKQFQLNHTLLQQRLDLWPGNRRDVMEFMILLGLELLICGPLIIPRSPANVTAPSPNR